MVGNTRRGRINGADERKRAAERLRELVANGEGGANTLGVTPGQMLLAGFEQSEPKLAEMLDRLEENFFESQAKFKVRLNDSYLLRGQPDPTGTLPEGSVYVVGMPLSVSLFVVASSLAPVALTSTRGCTGSMSAG